MIGNLMRHCERGRADAHRGHKQRLDYRTPASRCYADAWHRERRAMRKRGELPQCELPLDAEAGAR